ncbi:MAG: type IV secretory system conjugative DNA transfer family protein, partial [Lachnospiraceae bacterium]|nr:type IV secretory system conjugative DNA transfer family protein [Lachnospiraceae bacterium]
KTQLNNNVMVVGGNGCGKTRSIVCPNILQATGSYIIADPKGNLYDKYADYLYKKGYEVKIVNFTDPSKSAHYNFLDFIRNTQDVLKIAHMLTYSDQNGICRTPDPFWDEATELLYQSLIAYLCFHRPEKDRTLESIFKLIASGRVPEDNSDAESALDVIMNEIGRRNSRDFAYKQYLKYRTGAGKTIRSILITANTKLGAFDTVELNRMMGRSEIDFARIGRQKTAIFVVVSDTDRSMDTQANIFFTQAMNELCLYADTECSDQRLPVPVRFILDDFATNCKIVDFPRMISSIRSRGISVMLLLQAEGQLRSSYGNDAPTIISNCDTYVYLGGNDPDTANAIAIRCDLPLRKILYMPVDTNWIFRRGQLPVNGRNFVLEDYEFERNRSSRPMSSDAFSLPPNAR